MRGGLKNKNDQFRRLVRIQTGKKGVTEDEKNPCKRTKKSGGVQTDK